MSEHAAHAQFDALERLLLEAGSVAHHWESEPHRQHGWREARRLYIPPPEEIGKGKFVAALALREALAAVHHLRAHDARRHAAAALRCLVDAVRAERTRMEIAPTPPIRAYWVDRE